MGGSYDVVIAGGGVVGCATARALMLANPRLRVCLLDKEAQVATHQSGRNSGVIHAGYNQKPGSRKARFVVEGARRLRAFCQEQGVPLVQDGILVVARNEAEARTLEELRGRGEANGAQVCLLNAQELRAIEPEAAGIAALHAPEGSSFNSAGYVRALAVEAERLGVTFQFGAMLTGLRETESGVEIETAGQTLAGSVFINAAGLHADRLAQKLGVGRGYQIVPFRGYYSELRPERRALVNAHIYPCPDLNFPFLGVHLSKTFDERVLVGPGAALAGGREAYQWFQIHLRDSLQLLRYRGFWRLCKSPAFLALLRTEWKKSVSQRAVTAEARQLLPALRDDDLIPSRAGIRAQVVADDGRLVEDLLVEETGRSVHVLNAVSPALTCSLPFADDIAARALAKL